MSENAKKPCLPVACAFCQGLEVSCLYFVQADDVP